MLKKPVNFGDWSNGNGASEYEQNAFYSIVGGDIHSKPGSISASLARVRADANLVDALPTCKVVLPNGDILMGAGAKIFKISSSVVSIVHTDTNGAVIGIDYLGAYVYYATASKLGRQGLSNASSEASWSSQNDSWATFTNASTVKPMKKQNLSLHIGDGCYVAAVDDTGAFSPNVLDLEPNQIITALAKKKTYLMIGATAGTASDKSNSFLWDTFAPSWSDEDDIPERGFNCFIDGDSVIFASVGTVGNIYYFNGSEWVFFTQLKDGENLVATSINPYASANLNGLALFNTKNGIFSFGRAKASLPLAQVIEYAHSVASVIGAGALAVSGTQVFSGWQTASGYGIDKLSANKGNCVIKCPIIIGKADEAKIFYNSLPAGTSITARIKNDNGSWDAKTLTKDDTDERCYKTETKIGNKSTSLLEFTLVSSTTYSPEVYLIQAQ